MYCIREHILKTAKVLVEDTKLLVSGAGASQEKLAQAAQSSVNTITKLADVVKLGAASLGSEDPETQVPSPRSYKTHSVLRMCVLSNQIFCFQLFLWQHFHLIFFRLVLKGRSVIKIAGFNFANFFVNLSYVIFRQKGSNLYGDLLLLYVSCVVCRLCQVVLINAVKDVAKALGDLISATKAAAGKPHDDPAMLQLKNSAKVQKHFTSLTHTRSF